MNSWRTAMASALALGFVAAHSAPAQNQGKANTADDACKVESASSGDVRSAYNTITILQVAPSKPEDAQKKLRSAVKSLTSKDDYGKDVMARNYALGAALVLWAEQPGVPAVSPRANLGYARDQVGTVDILAAADSAFTAVETANPACKAKTEMYRQRPWVKMINEIGPLLGRNQVDSANAVLTRSLVIYRDSPYSYYFKGQIAQQKEDWTGAAEAYNKVLELLPADKAAADSNLAGVREYSEFTAAYAALRVAQKQSGAEQQAGMKKAADLYRQYLKDYPSGENAEPARAGLAIALQASGDTASLAAMWSEMAANPAQYTDAQLFEAGARAFAANQLDLAVRLMEAGEKVNPNLRGGLFNLANAYWKANQFDKMLPITRRLITIDPNSPDNYQLVAIAYQGVAKATTDAKAKKALSDSVTKYVLEADKIPVKIDVSEFTRDGDTTRLSGTVANIGKAPKSATLKVEFLDRAGNVVTTQTTPISVAPNETKKFSISVPGTTIAAFRYSPIR